MPDNSKFIPQELSWLAFNQRVLQEAADPRNPIIERVRFLGIFSSNQDEFFKVRMADLRRKGIREKGQQGGGKRKLITKIQDEVSALTEQFDTIQENLVNELIAKKIFFVDEAGLSEKQSRWLDIHFEEKIKRHIVPIWITDDIRLPDHLEDETSYLVVEIKKGDNLRYAVIDIPESVPRFITVPPDRGNARNYIMIVDEVIRHCLDQLFGTFVDYDRLSAWSMKFSRDSEYTLDDDLDTSLVVKLSEGVKRRRSAKPIRMSYDREMPASLVELLRTQLGLGGFESLVAGGRYRNFRDFIRFQNPGRKQLEFADQPSLRIPRLDQARNIFAALDEEDELLIYPYHRFSYFTEFVRQAAYDPEVNEIHINLYRVARHSRVVESLVDAARNGKHVSVNIELRARFDEEHNLQQSEALSDAGVNVTLGIPGLKVHSKLCVVSKTTSEGEERLYAVIATGNFNESTAQFYTDFALFTAHQGICREARSVFTFIEKSFLHPQLEHLWLSPLTTRDKLFEAIDQEIEIARQGKPAKITAKLNNLADKRTTRKLYEASCAGVKIDLLVRSVCELCANIENQSENIRVISILDRFLEHSRVYIFHNKGAQQVFISSADWMTRNLDGRVEITCPIYDQRLKKRVLDIIALQFKDNQKARILDKARSNTYVARGNRKKVRSQEAVYNLLSKSS